MALQSRPPVANIHGVTGTSVQPLNAYIYSGHWLSPETLPKWWDTEREMLKVGLLYGDAVTTVHPIAVMEPNPDDTPEFKRYQRDFLLAHKLKLLGDPGDPAEYRNRLAKLDNDPSYIPMLPPSGLSDEKGYAQEWHGILAAALLGTLEAFPDAEMDVIIDVRERIAKARAHFRAAMATAAEVLAQESRSKAEAEAAVAELRIKTVDPARKELEDELKALGVRSTLLRTLSDKATVASGALLAVTLGARGSIAAAIAAAATETRHRIEKAAELRRRPFWVLHETEERLRHKAARLRRKR